MNESAAPLRPKQIEEFWDLCDSQLISGETWRRLTGVAEAFPFPEKEYLEARRLWALAESRPGGAEGVFYGAPYDAENFLLTLATLSGEKWSSPVGEHRVFRLARWLLSLRGADGSRWGGFDPEVLLRELRAPDNPAVGAFVVSVADGEGFEWTPEGAALRAAALARNAAATEAPDPRAAGQAWQAWQAVEAAEAAAAEAAGREWLAREAIAAAEEEWEAAAEAAKAAEAAAAEAAKAAGVAEARAVAARAGAGVPP
jgi:hypothetical protein